MCFSCPHVRVVSTTAAATCVLRPHHRMAMMGRVSRCLDATLTDLWRMNKGSSDMPDDASPRHFLKTRKRAQRANARYS